MTGKALSVGLIIVLIMGCNIDSVSSSRLSLQSKQEFPWSYFVRLQRPASALTGFQASCLLALKNGHGDVEYCHVRLEPRDENDREVRVADHCAYAYEAQAQ